MLGIYEEFYQTIIFDDRYKYILNGIFNTVIIAIGAVILGTVIGIITSLIRDCHDKNGNLKILNFISELYVIVIRGTPSLIQLMIIYYIIFKSVNVNGIIIGILAFGLNSGAYISEIMRAGINSINKGQMEAALSLGLNYYKAMRYVIMPQAIKNILPALCNEFITLIKETSVAGYIGIMELTKAGDIIASRTYNYFFPLIICALIYLLMTTTLSKLLNKFERKKENA